MFTEQLMQVVSVATIQGGTAFNVIPDAATIGGTFRAFSKKSFYGLGERIEEVIYMNLHSCQVLRNFGAHMNELRGNY